MPRPLRIEYAGAWYHVMNRGANRQSIFKTNQHRNLMLQLLEEISDKFHIEIHAFCLMDNHYHLLIRTPLGNLNRAMRHLNGLYTQRYNKLMDRDGPLFRGRYKAILIDCDRYMLNVSRYIHLNPVEAKICNKPEDYKWSSYRYYANKILTNSWLHQTFILNQMTGNNQRKLYSDFIFQGNDSDTVHFYRRKKLSSIFGSDDFVDKMLNQLNENYKEAVLTDYYHTSNIPSIDYILNTVADYFHISAESILRKSKGRRNGPRLIAILLMKKFCHITQKELSEKFENIKQRSVSGIIRQYLNTVDNDNKLKLHIKRITQNILDAQRKVTLNGT